MIFTDACRDPEPASPTRWDDASYLPTQIARLHDELATAGQNAASVLRAAQLEPKAARSSDTKVSLHQILAAYRIAASLAPDPEFAFRIGMRNKVTYYGMYGFAAISAPNLDRMLDFVVEAQSLSANLVELRVVRGTAEVAIRIDPFVHRDINARVHRFLIEEMMGFLLTALRDLPGARFAPSAIRLTLSQQLASERVGELVDVPVRFDQKHNEFVFDTSWLSAPLEGGNIIVHDSVRRTCTELLGELHTGAALAHRVGEAVITHRGLFPSIEEIAAKFGMSVRGLRRKLEAEGTGYREICDEVRSQIAMKYLRDTKLPIERIAGIMGFDNAANFRRAFRRWTANTPAEYRTKTTS